MILIVIHRLQQLNSMGSVQTSRPADWSLPGQKMVGASSIMPLLRCDIRDVVCLLMMSGCFLECLQQRLLEWTTVEIQHMLGESILLGNPFLSWDYEVEKLLLYHFSLKQELTPHFNVW